MASARMYLRQTIVFFETTTTHYSNPHIITVIALLLTPLLRRSWL